MSKYFTSPLNIVPSGQSYKSAPLNDQEVILVLDGKNKNIVEYERLQTVSLAQVYDNERQESTIFRPTFKLQYVYDNTYTGTTNYIPFRNELFFINPEVSVFNNIWTGYPQYFEFDFFRPQTEYQNFPYETKSAYTYNWSYYITYACENDYEKQMYFTLDNTSLNFKAKEGIPFIINNITLNGNDIVSFKCIAPHGLTIGESVELSFKYNDNNLFEVFSLGNGNTDSDKYVFNIYNIGYTGNTFLSGVVGTFKRVLNPLNLTETKSKYYIRKHKIIQTTENLAMTKIGFEENSLPNEKKLEVTCITPDKKNKITRKTSSNTYSIVSKKNLDLSKKLDNQKRPISEIFLTIIHKGFSGYFNKPSFGTGVKQGWEFNITSTPNSWWADSNINSNSSLGFSSYTQTSGTTKTFYYNKELVEDSIVDGDFCEWNDYEQKERIISSFHYKMKFNQDVFQTEKNISGNSYGYYYKPHYGMNIRSYSSYVETGDVDTVDLIPSYSFFSVADQQFRWRDLYTYGFIDEDNIGVDYPFLNGAHYPYKDIVFLLKPEGKNTQEINIPIKPEIDACE